MLNSYINYFALHIVQSKSSYVYFQIVATGLIPTVKVIIFIHCWNS